MLFSRLSRKALLAGALLAASVAVPVTTSQAAAGARKIAARRFTARVSSQLFTTKTVVAPMHEPETFMPPRVQGDREFGGNGPEVTILVRYYVKGDRVLRQLFMRAAETSVTAGFLVSKPSVAAGWNRPKVIYVAPKGWAIRPFNRVDHRLPHYIDTDHAADVFGTPIGKVTVWGDGKGNDIGRTTRVHVDWDSELRIVIDRQADVASPRKPLGKPEG